MTYTVTVSNIRALDVFVDDPAVVLDDLADVLDDAVWLGNAAASFGAVSYTTPTLNWSCPLADAEAVQRTYSAKVNATTAVGYGR